MNTFRFSLGSNSVRNNVIDTVQANCQGTPWVQDFCMHLRECKRHGFDDCSEIMFILPGNIRIHIITTRVDGDSLTYKIPALPSLPSEEFKKKRWWKLF